MMPTSLLCSTTDFLTFFVLLKVFHSPEMLFHTGWFVESLAIQTPSFDIALVTRAPLRGTPWR